MMKSVKLIVGGICWSLFLLSCGDNFQEKSKGQDQSNQHEIQPTRLESQNIQLDHGEKWRVNAEMNPSIMRLQQKINDFSRSNAKDYKDLSIELQKDIDELISACTMKGQSHEELHKWLLPFIREVKNLSEFADAQEAEKHFEQLQTSITIYNQYFQ